MRMPDIPFHFRHRLCDEPQTARAVTLSFDEIKARRLSAPSLLGLGLTASTTGGHECCSHLLSLFTAEFGSDGTRRSNQENSINLTRQLMLTGSRKDRLQFFR